MLKHTTTAPAFYLLKDLFFHAHGHENFINTMARLHSHL